MDPLGVGHPRLRAPGPNPAWWPQLLLSPLATCQAGPSQAHPFSPCLTIHSLAASLLLPSDPPPQHRTRHHLRASPVASCSDGGQIAEPVSDMPSHEAAPPPPPHPQTTVPLSRTQAGRLLHVVTWTSPFAQIRACQAIFVLLGNLGRHCEAINGGKGISPFPS